MVRLTDILDKTISVDWDVKPNTKLEFRELDVSPGKTEVEQGVEFINSISPNPKFTLGIIRIRVKSLSSFQC